MEAALSRALQAQSLSSVNLGALRQPATIPYDTSVFQFRESVADALGLDSHEHLIGLGGAGVDESEHAPALPERYVGQKEKTVGGIKRGAWRGPATPWIQKWKAAKHKAPRTRFDALYVALLKEVILPHIGDPQGICFQREPTFRCHVSGGGESTGAPHIDADYGHQPSEINFWVPMTPVWGSNSLYSESAPGQGDFEAFELEYGEIKRFWGNQVWNSVCTCAHACLHAPDGVCDTRRVRVWARGDPQ
eukprot:2547615-Rhodomonas_salina.1